MFLRQSRRKLVDEIGPWNVQINATLNIGPTSVFIKHTLYSMRVLIGGGSVIHYSLKI